MADPSITGGMDAFFKKFNSGSDLFSRQLDPLNTFTVKLSLDEPAGTVAKRFTDLGFAQKADDIDLTEYTQEITMPRIVYTSSSTVQDVTGQYPVNSMFIVPDNTNLTFSMLSTKAPIFEEVLYPWMREVASPMWMYGDRPFTTAKITVSYQKHSTIKYVFLGARPVDILGQTTTQAASNTISRQAVFSFNHMLIMSSMKSSGGSDSVKAALKSVANSLLGNALR